MRSILFLAPLTVFYLLLLPPFGYAEDFFVSPNGSGVGSRENPWALSTALSHPEKLKPGDTIWLRNGTYGRGRDTLFRSLLRGTEEQPIVVRQYPGERATVDGAIQVESNSRWVWWWGFEITNSSLERKVSGELRRGGLNLLGRGHKVINLIIHDTGHPAIGYWRPVGDGGEIHGTLLWGNGLYDLDDPRFPDGWTRGSGIYAQNESGTRYISDVIAFRNFTTGIKLYTEGGWANGFHLEGNVCFDAHKWPIFGTSKSKAMERLTLLSNYTYRASDDSRYSVQFGYYSGESHQDARIQNNYFVSGRDNVLEMLRWSSLNISQNTLIGRSVLGAWQSGPPAVSLIWNENIYRGGASEAFEFNENRLSYSAWNQQTGFDAGSQFLPLPSKNMIVVRPNKYESGRAHIIVYNWEGLASVQVDISSSGLKNGDAYEVRDAQNFFGPPVTQGTYNGSRLSLPMNLKKVAPLIGDVTHISASHTAPEFALFVLLPRNAGQDFPGSPKNLRVKRE